MSTAARPTTSCWVELVEGNPNPSHWLIPALQEVLATLPQDEVARPVTPNSGKIWKVTHFAKQ